MVGQQLSSPGSEVSSALVGSSNIAAAMIEGIPCRSLVDSGSQISSVAEWFYRNSLKHVPLETLDTMLHIQGAGGHPLRYLGYIKVDISFPQGVNDVSQPALVLVVPDTDYNKEVPLLIGTNLIKHFFHEQLENLGPDTDNWPVSSAWKLAYQAMVTVIRKVDDKVIVAGEQVEIPAHSKAIITGLGQTGSLPGHCTALLEPSNVSLPQGLVISSSFVQLKPGLDKHYVQVPVHNVSGSDITISRNTKLCKMQYAVQVDAVNGVGTEDAEEFLEKFKLESLAHRVPDEVVSELKTLLLKWKVVFSQNDLDYGRTDAVKHEINLVDETPIKQRHRRIPPGMFEDVRKHLNEMLDAGIIRHSSSPWSSPLVFVKKSDSSIRICLDLRELNNKTVKDAYYLPRIEETLHLLSGSKFFTALDLKCGFWQVEIKEEHKERTAFAVPPFGLYECNRMPFGATNGPAVFQRLMERCVGDLQQEGCICYMDDLLIHSDSAQENLLRLEKVFTRLAEAGLKLKPSKCTFLEEKVKFLGHIVSHGGVQPDTDKISALTNWPVPKNLQDLRRFLGFAGFYRRFVKDFSKVASPLTELLQGHVPVKKGSRKNKGIEELKCKWGPQQQNAFEMLIEILTSDPVLGYADYSLPFVVHTDASGTGLGAVLYQKQGKSLRPIAYASRCLKKSERNYPAHKLEFLALKWAVTEKFYDYLYGQKFEVHTDNNPLTYILTTAKLDATSHRWLAALSIFDFSLMYRSGKKNIDADVLSRMYSTAEPSEPVMLQSQEVRELCASMRCDRPPVLQCQLHSFEAGKDKGSSMQPVNVKQMQMEDTAVKFAFSLVQDGRKPNKVDFKHKDTETRRLLHQWKRLKIVDGLLYRERQSQHGSCNLQLVLPKNCRDSVLVRLHDEMGHQGRQRTQSLVANRFYWPSMSADIDRKIRTCDRCFRFKKKHEDRESLVSIETTGPMELVCLDYLSLEPSQGYSNVLVITDHFTKFVQVVPTRNQSAITTAKALYSNFIVLYGIPARIHSDLGKCFESKVIKELCAVMGMEKSRTTPYHPQGNGVTERFNRTLINMIGSLPPDCKRTWRSQLPALVQAYNSTEHASTKCSPYSLMFGREPNLPVDVEYGLSNHTQDRVSYSEYVANLRKQVSNAFQVAKDNLDQAQSNQAKYYGKKVQAANLQPGDLVLVRNKHVHAYDKLADFWEKDLYKVVKKPYPDIPLFVVKSTTTGRKRSLHRNMLVPYLLKVDEGKKPEDLPAVDSKRSTQETESLESEDESVDEEECILIGEKNVVQEGTDAHHSTSSDAEQDSLQIEDVSDDRAVNIEIPHDCIPTELATAEHISGKDSRKNHPSSVQTDNGGKSIGNGSLETPASVTNTTVEGTPSSSDLPEREVSRQDTQEVSSDITSGEQVDKPEPESVVQEPPVPQPRRSTRNRRQPSWMTDGSYHMYSHTVSESDKIPDWMSKADYFFNIINKNQTFFTNPALLHSFIQLTGGCVNE